MPMATPTRVILSVTLDTEEVSTDSPVEMSMREISTRIIGMEKENSSSTMDRYTQVIFVWEVSKDRVDMILKEDGMKEHGREMSIMARVNSSTRMEAITLGDSSEGRLMDLEKNDWRMELFDVGCGSEGNSCKNAPKKNANG